MVLPGSPVTSLYVSSVIHVFELKLKQRSRYEGVQSNLS